MPHYSPTTGECTDRSTDQETRAAKTALAALKATASALAWAGMPAALLVATACADDIKEIRDLADWLESESE